ncbi:hypothetical protein Tco_0576725 [Tanacetum coccineum]
MQDHRGRQIIPKDYFINKDLEYLKGGDLSRWYSTSVPKTKAATYELKWIEDLVHELSMTTVTWKRLMRTDELHKFSDGTFNDVRTALHDIVEVDAESRDVCWWKDIRERSQASGKDKMTSSYSISTHFSQNQRDLPRDIPLDSVVVLRYEKRSKSENKGKVSTEMEPVLEQTQQGTSYEVSVSAEGVEELKRKVKIKGEKKEALLTLRYDEDVHFLRSVEMEFLAIVYNDVLTSELKLSCEPAIYNVDDLKLDMGNGDDKIDIKQSSGDLSIELLPNVININVGSGVGVDTAYPRHGYAVSSLMDMAYWLSE